MNRLPVIRKPINIESVITAGDKDIAGKSHVGICKAQERSAFIVFVKLFFLGLTGIDEHLCRPLQQIFRIKKSGRSGHCRNEIQAIQHLASVIESGCQAGTWIRR